MKRLLTLIVVPGLVAWGTGVANANLLINGNMDAISISSQNLATPTGWVATSDNFDGLSSEPWNNVADPGGKGVFFKTFFGDPATPFSASLYQDKPGTPGIEYTLKGWVGSGPGYSGELPGSGTLTEFALEFLDAGSLVIGSNVLSLGPAELSVVTGHPAGFDYAEYTRIAIAPAGTVTVRARISMINAYDVTGAGDPPLVTDNYTLTTPNSAVITNQPVHQSVSLGANVTFSVGVSNPPVSYQWQLNGTNLVNGGSISGATSQTLSITGVTASHVGHYRVLVSSTGGTVPSAEATLAIVGIGFYPTVTILGKIGDTYRVDYATALAPTTWIPLSTIVLTSSPQLVTDGSSPGSNTRFYQAVYVP